MPGASPPAAPSRPQAGRPPLTAACSAPPGVTPTPTLDPWPSSTGVRWAWMGEGWGLPDTREGRGVSSCLGTSLPLQICHFPSMSAPTRETGHLRGSSSQGGGPEAGTEPLSPQLPQLLWEDSFTPALSRPAFRSDGRQGPLRAAFWLESPAYPLLPPEPSPAPCPLPSSLPGSAERPHRARFSQP